MAHLPAMACCSGRCVVGRCRACFCCTQCCRLACGGHADVAVARMPVLLLRQTALQARPPAGMPSSAAAAWAPVVCAAAESGHAAGDAAESGHVAGGALSRATWQAVPLSQATWQAVPPAGGWRAEMCHNVARWASRFGGLQ
mmetsp:Transcript_2013/g.5283  ORF Transcript_2013/g.5283 Transcript_2013/m.5283 type:complete len:142 (+) Transcript_2013:411-836(+)|eukprot:365816-Chlamydomonas_euryale.AAC.7